MTRETKTEIAIVGGAAVIILVVWLLTRAKDGMAWLGLPVGSTDGAAAFDPASIPGVAPRGSNAFNLTGGGSNFAGGNSNANYQGGNYYGGNTILGGGGCGEGCGCGTCAGSNSYGLAFGSTNDLVSYLMASGQYPQQLPGWS